MGTLLGTQYQKAAFFAVPPSSGAFSSSSTSLPSHRLYRAVGSPPPPPPTTITSVTASAGRSSFTGVADSRGGWVGATSAAVAVCFGATTGTSLFGRDCGWGVSSTDRWVAGPGSAQQGLDAVACDRPGIGVGVGHSQLGDARDVGLGHAELGE